MWTLALSVLFGGLRLAVAVVAVFGLLIGLSACFPGKAIVATWTCSSFPVAVHDTATGKWSPSPGELIGACGIGGRIEDIL